MSENSRLTPAEEEQGKIEERLETILGQKESSWQESTENPSSPAKGYKPEKRPPVALKRTKKRPMTSREPYEGILRPGSSFKRGSRMSQDEESGSITEKLDEFWTAGMSLATLLLYRSHSNQ